MHTICAARERSRRRLRAVDFIYAADIFQSYMNIICLQPFSYFADALHIISLYF